MQNKNQPKIILQVVFAFLFLISIFSQNVSSLGVSPGRVEVDFVPEGEFSMQTCFTQYTTRYLKIEPLGFVADSITITSGVDKDGMLDTETTNGCLDYDIKLPKNFEKPGIQYGGLSATEVPQETAGNIYAVVKIIHQIYVKVPYPGKYLEVGVNAQNTPAGGTVPITVYLESKGVETITSANGIVTIYDSKDNLLATIPTDSAALIKTNERREIQVPWNSTTNREGNYKVKAQVTYDKNINNATNNFKLGGLDLNLVSFTNQLVLGGITKFYVEVDSIWSETIGDVKATVYVLDNSSNKVLQEFETLTKPVPAWSKATLQGYIDTQTLGLGDFPIQINLSFSNTTKQYDGRIKIVEPIKPEETKSKGKFVSTPLLLGMIGLITVIILVIVIILLLKKEKKKEEPQKTEQTTQKPENKK